MWDEPRKIIPTHGSNTNKHPKLSGIAVTALYHRIFPLLPPPANPKRKLKGSLTLLLLSLISHPLVVITYL